MNKLTDCLINKNNSCKPVWFMRQAGRYLPEFRAIRSKNKDFVKLCLNSNLSSEITLQPIRRFNLDAAIIFSDILMVPYALGQDVKFIKNEGPILSKINIKQVQHEQNINFKKKLKPVYDAIVKTRKNLSKDKDLISFVGAPWTLVVYMLGLKKNKDSIDLKLLEKRKEEIKIILKKLNEYLKIHIKNQVNAGANIVQIFDSWAGLLPTKYINDFCFTPNKKLVQYCKSINVPVICFPKGLKDGYSKFLKEVNPDGLNIDYNVDPQWAKDNLNNTCLQGGMDPKILLMSEKNIFEEASKYLEIFKNYPYIFNLGHGVLPETDPTTIARLVEFVRNYK
ncbi:uroporphyrinogen decarboxylase [Pelagibacteraceae bacterium]|nr:uroporphyrinogen decarboxylase [Pelagibacteraceae bacterium]